MITRARIPVLISLLIVSWGCRAKPTDQSSPTTSVPGQASGAPKPVGTRFPASPNPIEDHQPSRPAAELDDLKARETGLDLLPALNQGRPEPMLRAHAV